MKPDCEERQRLCMTVRLKNDLFDDPQSQIHLSSLRFSYEKIEFYRSSTIKAGCWMIAASCWSKEPDTTTYRKLEKTKKMTPPKLRPLRPTDLYVCICLVMAPTQIYIFMQQLYAV